MFYRHRRELRTTRWVDVSCFLATLLLLVVTATGSAQNRGGGISVAQPAAVPRDAAGHPDISGYWDLRYDRRSVTPASLTQEGMSKVAAQQQHDLLAIRFCALVGMPEVMDDGGTLDIRQSLKDVAIVAKSPSSVRYIYLDERSHPAKDEIDPVTNGNSIGRWDGDALNVDTIGFSDRGITAIPGGGFRTPDSHLVERFRLLNGGNTLSVTSTWDDSKVFQKAHSYEFRYYKIPRVAYPLQYGCNANDQDRANFVMSAGNTSDSSR
jgi:hypothetical protein